MLQLVSCMFLFILLFLLYYLSIKKHDYWKIRNVPYMKPLPLFGNYLQCILLRQCTPLVTQSICMRFPGEPLVGAFYGTQPSLIVQDPDIIKLVTAKQFNYFNSREVADYTDREPLTQNLFFTHGDKWKVIRQNLTHLFTSSKMKNMFYLVEKCAQLLKNMLDDVTAESPVVEVRPLIARYTMDCIGSCAFGVETKTMIKSDKPNPYGIIGGKIFENSWSRGLKLMARAMWPAVFYTLGYQVFPREIIKFFERMLREVFISREYKPTNRNDFVDLMLYLKQNKYLVGDSMTNLKTGDEKKVKLEVSDELLSVQCVGFFAAGYETTATTLSYALYLLAKNQQAQKKVIHEVDQYLSHHDGKIGYECVHELPYVEACVLETNRLYPVLGVITREVVEEYTLPTGLRLEKGLRIHIPVYHINHNPEYFPEPEEFQPERFLGERKETIRPYTFMPFGEGPRSCIGVRFAKMQMMSGLVALFSRYCVARAADTPDHIQFDPTAIVTHPTAAIHLKFTRREKKTG